MGKSKNFIIMQSKNIQAGIIAFGAIARVINKINAIATT